MGRRYQFRMGNRSGAENDTNAVYSSYYEKEAVGEPVALLPKNYVVTGKAFVHSEAFLPDDLLSCVIEYLPTREVLNLCSVCKQTGRLADESIWKRLGYRKKRSRGNYIIQAIRYFSKRLSGREFFIEKHNIQTCSSLANLVKSLVLKLTGGPSECLPVTLTQRSEVSTIEATFYFLRGYPSFRVKVTTEEVVCTGAQISNNRKRFSITSSSRENSRTEMKSSFVVFRGRIVSFAYPRMTCLIEGCERDGKDEYEPGNREMYFLIDNVGGEEILEFCFGNDTTVLTERLQM